MKLQVAVFAVLATFASAGLVKRQTSNDLKSGGCKKAVFIFARGSTEPGNMVEADILTAIHLTNICLQGRIIGPPTCNALKKKLSNDVACQGVGGGYTAAMGDNGKPGGTSPEAVQVCLIMTFVFLPIPFPGLFSLKNTMTALLNSKRITSTTPNNSHEGYTNNMLIFFIGSH
jgi:hypothetical protein